MSGMIFLSFLLFMTLFAGVGLSSMMVKKDTTDDYLVAGRGMHPALAALSAVSTWNSGYMFIGFIGYVFLTGYSAIWIALVSTVGQIIAWLWLYKFIQEEGNNRGIRSLTSLVSKVQGAPEAKLAAYLSVFLLSVYAAAQLTAGGLALKVMLDLPVLYGILIGFVLVVAYCYAGGIRASIWTDAIQSCVMIVGSTLLCIVALGEVGGFSGLHNSLTIIDPTITSFIPTDRKLGISLWILAFFLGGLGVAGQPQVVSRVMTLGGEKERKQATLWFFVWQTPFIAIMFIIGLTCRAIFLDSTFDPELGLPTIAMAVLSPFWVGLILASIFAATMSTADSQVLACTAAITDDIKPEWSQDHKTTKKVTLFVAAFATSISICGLYIPGGDSVFSLVVLAVYGLGAIFIPLLLIRMCGYEPDTRHTITMMVAAFSGVLIWRFLGLNEYVFESVPGIGSAFIAHFMMCYLREESDSSYFGRYKIPKPMLNQGFVVIVILFFISEIGYSAVSPDSGDQGMEFGEDWWWDVEFNSSYEADTLVAVGVNNGDTVTYNRDVYPETLHLGLVNFRILCNDLDDNPLDTPDKFSVEITPPDGINSTSFDGQCDSTSYEEAFEIIPGYDGDSKFYLANQTSESMIYEMWTLDSDFGHGEWIVDVTLNTQGPLLVESGQADIEITSEIFTFELNATLQKTCNENLSECGE